jgi:arabinose-5-phosphate isomerase
MSQTNAKIDSKDTVGPMSDVEAALHVLELEADGIRALTDVIDDNFRKALDLLESATGRIIVTGMGKSGYIAGKIAATLASTGTPAFYVHPGEASHGDLGMITAQDAVIALSNSGGTAELRDILEYTRRFSIPLIAITAKARSPLAETADITLLLSSVPEACPMGLAPTTSTTASMALGDAIAVALLQRKGFTAEDYSVLHPGGRLGVGLRRVSELMHTGDAVPLCTPEQDMSEAILLMTSKRFGCLGVIGPEGKLIGIVTDGDLRRHMDSHLLDRTAGEVMTAAPMTIRPQALAVEALALMNDPTRPITALYVVDDTGPVGIVHIHDLLRAGVR